MKNLSIALFFFLLISGCTGTKSFVSIEILEPASITYPESVEKIGYLNRSPLSRDAFAQEEFKVLEDRDIYIIDTMICGSLRRGFESAKKESSLGYLDDILYLETRKRDTAFQKSFLTQGTVADICRNFELDALITQDYYAIEFEEFVNLNLVENNYEKLYTLIQDVRWTVYLEEENKPLDIYHFHDTLYFMKQETWPTEKHLTPLEMMRQGSFEVGYAFGLRHIPVWNEVARVVYVGMNPELRQAVDYTNLGEWERAVEIWNRNLDSENIKLAAKSAHNIAVYYEIDDDLDTALEYSALAKKLWPSPRIEFYNEELEIRVMNRKDIMRQMRVGGFN